MKILKYFFSVSALILFSIVPSYAKRSYDALESSLVKTTLEEFYTALPRRVYMENKLPLEDVKYPVRILPQNAINILAAALITGTEVPTTSDSLFSIPNDLFNLVISNKLLEKDYDNIIINSMPKEVAEARSRAAQIYKMELGMDSQFPIVLKVIKEKQLINKGHQDGIKRSIFFVGGDPNRVKMRLRPTGVFLTDKGNLEGNLTADFYLPRQPVFVEYKIEPPLKAEEPPLKATRAFVKRKNAWQAKHQSMWKGAEDAPKTERAFVKKRKNASKANEARGSVLNPLKQPSSPPLF